MKFKEVDYSRQLFTIWNLNGYSMVYNTAFEDSRLPEEPLMSYLADVDVVKQYFTKQLCA